MCVAVCACACRYKAPLSLEVHPLWGRVAFLLRPLTLADLIAFVPAVVSLAQRQVTGPWMLLRVFRLFRFYRHSRLLGALTELVHVIRQRAGMLLATVVLDASLLLVLGALMYYVEAGHPDTKFTSNILITDRSSSVPLCSHCPNSYMRWLLHSPALPYTPRGPLVWHVRGSG